MSPETITAPAPHLVRVEKGRASDEELAAVTALLMARASSRHAAPEGDDADRNPAAWRRLERARAYRAPHSWQG
ncbi:acyl-CoA carboxylase subunit epsilon [Streptomyces sp. NBC_01803]|uniref:acyl-CoA carboxylase subunit epsilon n=1 Tax=Streptomyces sp. NBC_01803 TaxID=2975946 RepID=UPI002DD7A902|nr:acyl-CoA carboxylase subunit epsilon [Streptomyces sp. NBC_01803]WSA44034.1 acyl-CoA carboxylase subunit epsilon [Streptomyces sp. NBC_01803]